MDDRSLVNKVFRVGQRTNPYCIPAVTGSLQLGNCVSCSQLFERLGYHSIILQIGRGVYEPEIIDRTGFSMKYYRYKDSIEGDIQRASLVISHAGMANFKVLSS